MKTSVIEVRDMLSVLSVLGVEERIGEVPGVDSVTVNFSAGNATVRYDETRLDIGDIKSGVRQRSHDADGEAAASPAGGHESRAASDVHPATPESASASAGSPGAAQPIKATPAPAPKPATDAAATVPAADAGDEHQEKAVAGKT